MALIIEFLGKDNKSAIINTQYMLKKVEKNMSMMKREMESINNT